jgi:hypothetical protein
MEFTGNGPDERVVFTDVNELQAAGFIVNAMHRFFSDSSNGENENETLDFLERTRFAIQNSVELNTETRQGTQLDNEVTHRFGNPFLGIIETSIAVFEQNEGTLEPFMSEDEVMQARIYFPVVSDHE